MPTTTHVVGCQAHVFANPALRHINLLETVCVHNSCTQMPGTQNDRYVPGRLTLHHALIKLDLLAKVFASLYMTASYLTNSHCVTSPHELDPLANLFHLLTGGC